MELERIARGQIDNPQWFNYRKGMLTTSKFYEACHMLPSINPERFIWNIISDNYTFGGNIPAPLRYGLQNKKNAVST